MEKEKEKENDWDLFIDLEKEPNNKKIEYLSQWNKVAFKRKVHYHYTIEICSNNELEHDFFKNRQIKEKNKYLDKMMNYKLKTK